MAIDSIKLPSDLIETLKAVHQKAKRIDPNLTEEQFLEQIFREWLEPYKRERKFGGLKRNSVRLKNNLKTALKLAGKTQAELARETGINKVHLSRIINGKYEPSITVALILADALRYPPEKIKDLFYLVPARKE